MRSALSDDACGARFLVDTGYILYVFAIVYGSRIAGCISDIICIISKLSRARNAALFAVKFPELASRWSWEFDFERHKLYDEKYPFPERKRNAIDRSVSRNLIHSSILWLKITMNINESRSRIARINEKKFALRASSISRENIYDKSSSKFFDEFFLIKKRIK